MLNVLENSVPDTFCSSKENAIHLCYFAFNSPQNVRYQIRAERLMNVHPSLTGQVNVREINVFLFFSFFSFFSSSLFLFLLQPFCLYFL